MLSIFIPSFNHAQYVTEAIASARQIDVPGKHIYVIDDASTDNSAQIIDAYLAQGNMEDVTFIRKDENKGSIDSMITFLNLCNGEYIYSIASDDIAIPAGISELVRHLDDNPSLQLVIGGGKNLMPDGSLTPIYGKRQTDLFAQPTERFAKSIFLMESSPLLCQSTVFRASALRAADTVAADVVADDYAIFLKLFLRFNRRGIDYDFLPHVDCVRYRHHGDNSYRKILRQVATSLQVLEAVAPKQIRDRAIAYKLAFYTLVAIKRRDASSAQRIMRLARLRQVPWIIPGLIMNTYWWSKYQ